MNTNIPNFNRPIIKSLQWNENSIIQLAYNNKVEYLLSEVVVPLKINVCCLSPEGKILWWIQDFVDHLNEKGPLMTDKQVDLLNWTHRSYTNIWVENDSLKAFNGCGYICTIDPLTGKIIEMEDE